MLMTVPCIFINVQEIIPGLYYRLHNYSVFRPYDYADGNVENATWSAALESPYAVFGIAHATVESYSSAGIVYIRYFGE